MKEDKLQKGIDKVAEHFAETFYLSNFEKLKPFIKNIYIEGFKEGIKQKDKIEKLYKEELPFLQEDM